MSKIIHHSFSNYIIKIKEIVNHNWTYTQVPPREVKTSHLYPHGKNDSDYTVHHCCVREPFLEATAGQPKADDP